MSGGTYVVGGIEVDRTVADPFSDERICSVFYQMAAFASDGYVRQALQDEITRGGALQLPSVWISDPDDPSVTRAVSIAGGSLQVKIPLASPAPDLALDTRDISICVAILENASIIQDALLCASAQNGAKAGLRRIAEVFAQHVTAYQPLRVSEMVQSDSIQVIWNNMAGTTQVQLERWEVGQSTTQLLATLDGSVNSFTDTSASHAKVYVYGVKNFRDGELIAAGSSKRVGF